MASHALFVLACIHHHNIITVLATLLAIFRAVVHIHRRLKLIGATVIVGHLGLASAFGCDRFVELLGSRHMAVGIGRDHLTVATFRRRLGARSSLRHTLARYVKLGLATNKRLSSMRWEKTKLYVYERTTIASHAGESLARNIDGDLHGIAIFVGQKAQTFVG